MVALRIKANPLLFCNLKELILAINTISSAALAAVANGSEFILTSELAALVRRAEQTIRKSVSEKGHFFGIVPMKLGRLNQWRVRDVDALLSGVGN